MALNPKLQIVTTAARSGRKIRSPRHTFHVRHKPWLITPFMIAPVLPGETMKSALCQSLIVTPPVKNGLIGWWYEQYFFYVKHRDLNNRDNLTAMHLSPTFDLAATINQGDPHSAMPELYYSGSGINWTALCLARVVDQWFRNEGEDTSFDDNGAFVGDHGVLDSLPLASTATANWLDSAKLADQVAFEGEGDDVLPGFIDKDPDEIYPGYAEHFAQWQHMTAVGLVQVNFEDYLKSFGVRVPAASREELHRPELLRFVKDWTYPTSIVDPLTGNPARGCIWKMDERLDKDRFFAEPGFLFGVCVARPKIYLSGIKGSAVELMDNAFRWLPAVLNAEPYTSLVEVEKGHAIMPGAGELGENDQNIWVDIADLFMYGDQFVNFATTATDAGMVAHPTAGMERRYVTQADITGLFPAAGSQLVTAEGIVTLNIATRLGDQSGRSNQGVGFVE